jgi:protein-disulfide isomerase
MADPTRGSDGPISSRRWVRETRYGGRRGRMGDRLRFVFRAFPLTRIRDHAQAAGEATQGRFWEMHDRLFEANRRLGEEDLLRFAEESGLDVRRFGREMAEHAHAGRVRRDLESGLRSGGPGTPTFFIKGVRHDGSHDFERLLAALEGAGG